MKEIYGIIIEKLERDKISFDREISEVIDYVEYDSIAKLSYDRAKAKRDYCMDLIEFFKEDGEMDVYLESIYNLVDSHVKRYIERSFTSLMISFGCTGGQHRSVYASQRIAEHISKKFGVKVSLIHREQNLEQAFKKR